MSDPELFSECKRRSRKTYACCECGAVISPGDQYLVARGLWEGRWSTYRTCLVCDDLRHRVIEGLHYYDEGPCFTELYDYAQDADMLSLT